jgi:hypothetical protein
MTHMHTEMKTKEITGRAVLYRIGLCVVRFSLQQSIYVCNKEKQICIEVYEV